MYSGLARSPLRRLALRRSSRVSINHPLLCLRLASPLLQPKASSVVSKQSRTIAMNSITADYVPEPTGSDPKQLGYLPSLKLSDGNEIPMLGYGLGTANFKRGAQVAAGLDQKIIDDTVTAIKAGFYHLDGAEAYGNEEELGIAIKTAGVPREKLFVTTKTFVKKGDTVEQAFSRSLKKLNLDYVDLYLIHQPWFTDSAEGRQAKWAEMEAIKESGRARSIGVSNFLQEHLEPVLATAKYPPVINQIEFHPYLQHGKLPDFLRENKIAVAAYGPLTAVTKASPGPLDPVYERLANKYGVTTGELALRWYLDQGVVAITTSSNEQRLKGIISKVPAFKLTPKEAGEIKDVGTQKHFRGFFKDKFDADDRS